MNLVRVIRLCQLNHAHHGQKVCRRKRILGPLLFLHRGFGIGPKSSEESTKSGKVVVSQASIKTAKQKAETSAAPLLLLVDGHSLAFRCYYAFRRNGKGLCAISQIPTSVTHGFLKCLLEYSCAMNPQGVAVAFDSNAPSFRQKRDMHYKANRDAHPEDFCMDLNNLQGVLRNAFRIPIFECPGYEADDVLGTLANKAVDDGWRVRILTGDQDLFQLVDDIRDIACLYLESKSHKYANSIRPMDADRVLAKLGVVPSSIVDFKALAGDSSDNFPGVKGIGSKTASRLLREHKTLDSIYASLDQSLTIGPTVKKKLYDDREAAYHCQFLAKIKVDVPLDTPISWELAQADVETLADNLQELNLKYLQGRFCDLIKIFSNNAQCHEFDLKLQLLLAFRQREGHSNVPPKHVEHGVNLGKWFHKQRACHRKGPLHAGRQVQLEEAGVLWHLTKGFLDANNFN